LFFSITGKHVEITDAMREHARDKASKLPRYYNSITKVEVIVDGGESSTPMVEVIATGEHNKIFVAKERGVDVYSCIDLAVHKVERQLTKKKGIERENKRGE
jgi:putative sigma-54 modulation protein